MAYCPLPPGYQAVYACSDGSLTAEAIVALSTNREREHEPVVFRPGEGFTTLEARPDWYLAPGETLNDARAGIRERDEDRARYLAERGKPAR
jgi:hypothetical protein